MTWRVVSGRLKFRFISLSSSTSHVYVTSIGADQNYKFKQREAGEEWEMVKEVSTNLRAGTCAVHCQMAVEITNTSNFRRVSGGKGSLISCMRHHELDKKKTLSNIP